MRFLWGKTDVRDFSVEVRAGEFSKYDNQRINAANRGIPNGSNADIWAYGPSQAALQWPATNSAWRIRAGGAAADTAGGANAQEIECIVLDNAGNRQTFTLPTNGALASVASTITGRRLLFARVSKAGTAHTANAGKIIIEHIDSGFIAGVIDHDAQQGGYGETQQSHYTIPKGYTGYLKKLDLWIDGTKPVDFHFWHAENAYNTAAPFGAKEILAEVHNATGFIEITFTTPKKLLELTDIWATGYGLGASSALTLGYCLQLKKS